MNKLWLIIRREYLVRVKKRSFILATLLTPLALGLFFVVVGFIFTYQGDETKKIAIVDEGNILNGIIKDEKNLYFSFEGRSLDDLRRNFEGSGYDGILYLPEITDINRNSYTPLYYAEDQLGLEVRGDIERKLRDVIRDYKIEKLNLDKEALDALRTDVNIDPEPIVEGDKDESSMAAGIGAAIGGFLGFVMYFTVFVYGMMVMRSVMEEKVNRIVEVMISSVKPFQLMLGKILGVGGVGLTQLAIWAILIPLISMIVSLVFGFDSSPQMDLVTNSGAEFEIEDSTAMIIQIMDELKDQNWWLIIPLSIFYFLGGYLLYSSLFAAIGSAMSDDMGESQALTIPITIPVIIAFYIMIVALRSPNSTLAVWSSIFPLFSPIVMPARLAFDIPTWQIIASLVSLVLGVLFFVWLSGRIYRVGILLYGKKVTLKELGKWMFYKV